MQFWQPGTVLGVGTMPGVLLHDVDTFKGQSGSPVWMLTRSGQRLLVGIHIGARVQRDAKTQARLRVTANKAVHLSPDVVAWVRSLIPGTA